MLKLRKRQTRKQDQLALKVEQNMKKWTDSHVHYLLVGGTSCLSEQNFIYSQLLTSVKLRREKIKTLEEDYKKVKDQINCVCEELPSCCQAHL